MSDLTSIETVRYNGFTFPVDSIIEVDSRFRYDQADRSVGCTVYSIRVHAKIMTDAVSIKNQEDSLSDIRRRLQKPGKDLAIFNTGFGDLSVNFAEVEDDNGNAIQSLKKDALWGPKPRTLSWRSLGPYSCEVSWACEVAVAECEDEGLVDGAVGNSNIMAYNFSISTSRDAHGYTTRSITGYIEIPQTRFPGSDLVSDDVDLYWNDSTYPPVPVGFRRTQNQTTKSDDSRRLNFMITDMEMADNILPADVVDCHASQVTQSHGASLVRQFSVLRASYTLRKGVDKSQSAAHFIGLLFQRISAIREKGGTAIIPTSFSAEDPDIYGRAAGSFTATFSWVANVGNELFTNDVLSIERAISQSGLFTRPNTTYQSWRNSMSAVFSPHGAAGLRTSSLNEKIVDICVDGGPSPPKGEFFVVAHPEATPKRLLIPVPKGNGSYLYWNMRLHFLSKAGAVHYKTLKTRGAINLGEEIGGAAANIGAGVDLLGGLSDAGVALGVGFSRFLGGIFGGDQPGENRYESTKRTTDSCEAILTYDIYRVGEKPLNPSLVRVGDVNDIYQLESNVSFSTVAFFFVPVHRLYGWNRYLIKSRPTDVADYPPNFYVFGYGLVENNAGNQAGNR